MTDNLFTPTLTNLPDELKLKIFGYLDGTSKINLLNVCEDTQRVVKDSSILRSLDFSQDKNVSLEHLSTLHKKRLSHLVKILNLNYVYWIPSQKLTPVLRKFKNVVELHLIGTRMYFTDLINLVKTLKKVQKLSLTIDETYENDILLVKYSIKVKNLFIKCSHVLLLLPFLKNCKELDCLWINEVRPYKTVEVADVNFNNYEFPLVKKQFVVVQERVKSDYISNYISRFMTNNNGNWIKKSHSGENLVITALFNPDYYNTTTANNSEYFNKCMKNLHFYEDHLEASNYKNYKYLNLLYEDMTENKLQQIRDVLFSNAVKNLKILKCYASVFLGTRNEQDEEFQYFKRRRIGVGWSYTNGATEFEKFTDYVPNLEELTIVDDINGKCDGARFLDSLKFLIKLNNFKKIVITSSNCMVGQFLVDILKNCKNLRSIKIENKCEFDKISRYICTGLPFAKNLKEFRFVIKGYLSLNPIFVALSKCKSLERVAIECKDYYNFEPTTLIPFLKSCSNLCFLAIKVFTGFSSCSIIQKNLTPFLKNNKFTFLLEGTKYSVTAKFIAFYHCEEMMYQDTFPNINICFLQHCH